MVSWKPCLIATAGYEYNCLVVHVTWYYTAYCIYVYTKAREDEFRELYRSYWRLAGLTDELWRTALVFTKSTSVKTGGQAPPLPNASYATAPPLTAGGIPTPTTITQRGDTWHVGHIISMLSHYIMYIHFIYLIIILEFCLLLISPLSLNAANINIYKKTF